MRAYTANPDGGDDRGRARGFRGNSAGVSLYFDRMNTVGKQKLYHLGIVLTSLLGYLEWGGNNASFLFQGEYEVLSKLFTDPVSVVHPFTVIPLVGQLLLLSTLLQRRPGRLLAYSGIACLGLLLGFMLLIGLLGMNFRILLSTIPFWVMVVLAVRGLRRPDGPSGSASG